MQLIRENERNTPCLRGSRHATISPLVAEPSVFHALQSPSITPIEYLRRLSRYAFCSRSVFITAFYYLDRIAAVPALQLQLTTLCVHRLVLTAVVLATKVVDDVLYDNVHFAKVGGLEVCELNVLELDLLKVLDFKLYVSAEQFESFERRLLDEALSTEDSDFSILPSRLRGLGYGTSHSDKRVPSSPTSAMEISFSTP